MQEIMFRGQTPGGVMVYSRSVKFNYGRPGQLIPYLLADGWTEVKPESLAQLVGYDKNGTEIFSGDVLLDDFGAKVKATIGFNLSYDKLIRPIGEKVEIVEVIKDA